MAKVQTAGFNGNRYLLGFLWVGIIKSSEKVKSCILLPDLPKEPLPMA